MSKELRYYDALKRITKYASVDSLHKNAERQYGVSGSEAIEMAYENVIEEARSAIRNQRRPKPLAAGKAEG